MTFWDFLDRHWFIGPATVCFLAVCLVVLLSDLAGYAIRAFAVRGMLRIAQEQTKRGDDTFDPKHIRKLLGDEVEEPRTAESTED